jgi:hypothetical protein
MTGEMPVTGRTGVLRMATPGGEGAGEVTVRAREGSQTFLAHSEEPLAAGTTVLVVGARSADAVDVVAWSDPFLARATTGAGRQD